ncbi:MAG TPA: metal-dependent hydrolase [Vicinamibacterales bacterium]|jgi:membrane-bound metal-dependent hydrolase YbcI (DUF457 family)
MPSPLGHVIAGVAAGWAIAGAPRPREGGRVILEDVLLFGALGALPDVDLIVGVHSGPTHSIGAALIVATIAFLAARFQRIPRPFTTAAACCAAYASHVLLDWLATDSSPPIGIMALWPFRSDYYESDLHLFMAISRRYWTGWSFIHQNAIAVVREIAILLPMLGIVALVRRRR